MLSNFPVSTSAHQWGHQVAELLWEGDSGLASSELECPDGCGIAGLLPAEPTVLSVVMAVATAQ